MLTCSGLIQGQIRPIYGDGGTPFRVASINIFFCSIDLLIASELDIPCQIPKVQIFQVASYT